MFLKAILTNAPRRMKLVGYSLLLNARAKMRPRDAMAKTTTIHSLATQHKTQKYV